MTFSCWIVIGTYIDDDRWLSTENRAVNVCSLNEWSGVSPREWRKERNWSIRLWVGPSIWKGMHLESIEKRLLKVFTVESSDWWANSVSEYSCLLFSACWRRLISWAYGLVIRLAVGSCEFVASSDFWLKDSILFKWVHSISYTSMMLLHFVLLNTWQYVYEVSNALMMVFEEDYLLQIGYFHDLLKVEIEILFCLGKYYLENSMHNDDDRSWFFKNIDYLCFD